MDYFLVEHRTNLAITVYILINPNLSQFLRKESDMRRILLEMVNFNQFAAIPNSFLLEKKVDMSIIPINLLPVKIVRFEKKSWFRLNN